MMRKGIAACWVLLATSLLTTGCGDGAETAPADPAGTIEPAPAGQTAVHPAPQIECRTGADPAPPAPADAVEPVPAGQSAAPDQGAPGAAQEATPTDPDPCAPSVSRTAGPGEAAEALEYWTPERMESAVPAPMTGNE